MMKIIKCGEFKTENPVKRFTCNACDSIFETNEYTIVCKKEYDSRYINGKLVYANVDIYYATINCPVCHSFVKIENDRTWYEADDPYHR